MTESVRAMGDNGKRDLWPVDREHGTSMGRLLRPGRRMQVEFLGHDTCRQIRFGDVLVFWTQAGRAPGGTDQPVVHRYLGSKRVGGEVVHLRTRGDNRHAFDPPVRFDDLLGRVVGVEHPGSWFTLCGRRARLYASLMALHDLAWGAVGSLLAEPLDRRLERFGLRWTTRTVVERLDLALASVAYALLFRLAHRPAPAPTTAAEGA